MSSDGVMLTYHSQLFDGRGIYDELRDSNDRFSNIFTSSREYFIGANVHFDAIRIQGAYTHYAAPDTPAGLADSANHYWLGATWQVMPRWAVTGGDYYIKAGDGSGDASRDPSGHAMMYAFGTTYILSKRTFLYGTVAYVSNGSKANFSLLATPRDSTSSTSPLTGESQRGAYVGMMHQF